MDLICNHKQCIVCFTSFTIYNLYLPICDWLYNQSNNQYFSLICSELYCDLIMFICIVYRLHSRTFCRQYQFWFRIDHQMWFFFNIFLKFSSHHIRFNICSILYSFLKCLQFFLIYWTSFSSDFSKNQKFLIRDW